MTGALRSGVEVVSNPSEMELAAVKRLVSAVETMAVSQEAMVRLLLEITEAIKSAERG
jgi:hypothetical protein